MSKLELKVPQVIVWLAMALLMGLGARAIPSPGIAWPQRLVHPHSAHFRA